MSIEQPNPYSSPAPVVHGKSPKSRRAVLAFGVCGLLLMGMLVAQLIARSHLASYGFELPVLTHMVLNPFFVCLPLLGLPFVLASRSWKSKLCRVSVCAFSILFAILCVACFSLSIYLPIVAIRIKLGL